MSTAVKRIRVLGFSQWMLSDYPWINSHIALDEENKAKRFCNMMAPAVHQRLAREVWDSPLQGHSSSPCCAWRVPRANGFHGTPSIALSPSSR